MKKPVKSRRILALAGATALIAIAVTTVLVRGIWNENTAVHVVPSEIESSTLAIGTHLIHLSALNDNLYELATASAQESNQTSVYYKSELADGAWFDISAASTLADITTGGTPVDDAVIAALFFTHHTKSDKVTYDLRTGSPVNIFNIRDPYALEQLEELMPLKMQYDMILDGQGKNDTTARIDQFWQTDMPESLAEYDQNINALQTYLDVLNANNGGTQETGIVTSVMGAVDAGRRYLVFETVDAALSAYVDELSANADADPALLSAAVESIGNVQNALITHGGKMLSEGVTAVSSLQYKYSNLLIEHAKANDHASCDGDVRALLALSNLLDNIIGNREFELSLLDDELMTLATNRYTQSLWAGVTTDYLAAVQNRTAEAVLRGMISESASLTESKRNELEFMIEARCMRVSAQLAIAFIDQRLDLTTRTFAAAVPNDDLAASAKASVDAHIDFLTKKRRALEQLLGGNEMDSLMAQKSDLQTQRLSALDKGDLAGAKALENQINDLENQQRSMENESASQLANLSNTIRDLEKQRNDALSSGNDALASALDSQLSQAKADRSSLENSLSDGSLGATVAQLKSDALSAIDTLSGNGGGTGAGLGAGAGAGAGAGTGSGAGTGTGSSSGAGDGGAAVQLDNAVNGLTGLLGTDPGLVFPALQEVYNAMAVAEKLGGAAGLGNALDAIEQAILDNPDAYDAALRDEKSADDLQGIFDAWLSGRNLGPDGELILLAALQMYREETGSNAASKMAISLARKIYNHGEIRVYERINDAAGMYVPLKTIERITGRRFVWNQNQSLGVLARGADYYGFTLYSTRVLRDKEGTKTEFMAQPAKNLSGLHIPSEYALAAFEVQTLYIYDTSYGCSFQTALLPQVEELLGLFLT